MQIVTILLLGLATNLDNLFIGMALGVGGRRVGWQHNGIIALMSGIVAGLFCWGASLMSSWGQAASIVGGLLLIAIGIWSMRPTKDQELQRGHHAAPMRMMEACAMGLVLSINCVAAALGAGLIGVSPWAIPVIALMSLITVAVGNRIGLHATARLRERALNAASGLMMIVLGLIGIFF